jgi:hypothetical protein
MLAARDRSVPNSRRKSRLHDLNSFDKPVDSILRVADHREEDALGHGLHREDRGILAGAHLPMISLRRVSLSPARTGRRHFGHHTTSNVQQ